jgi:hypothetical protein
LEQRQKLEVAIYFGIGILSMDTLAVRLTQFPLPGL